MPTTWRLLASLLPFVALVVYYPAVSPFTGRNGSYLAALNATHGTMPIVPKCDSIFSRNSYHLVSFFFHWQAIIISSHYCSSYSFWHRLIVPFNCIFIRPVLLSKSLWLSYSELNNGWLITVGQWRDITLVCVWLGLNRCMFLILDANIATMNIVSVRLRQSIVSDLFYRYMVLFLAQPLISSLEQYKRLPVRFTGS